MANIESYHAKFELETFEAERLPQHFVDHKIDEMKRDAIFKAVEQAGGEWICVRVRVETYQATPWRTPYLVNVDCQAVRTVPVVMAVTNPGITLQSPTATVAQWVWNRVKKAFNDFNASPWLKYP